MASSFRLDVRLSGEVNPVSPVAGSPVVGKVFTLFAATSSANNAISAQEVASGASASINLAALADYTVAGILTSSTCRGWMVVVEPDGTGATPTGAGAITIAGDVSPEAIRNGGIFLFFPNTGGNLSGTIVVDMSTTTGLKATFYAAR